MKNWKEIPTPRLWVICPVVVGVLAFLLRVWQRATAYEGDLELMIPGAPASVVLTVVLILAAVLFLLLAIRQKEARVPHGEAHRKLRGSAMYAKDDTVCLSLMVIAAFAALISVPVMVMQGWQLRQDHLQAMASGREHSNNGTLMMLTGVSSLLTFGGLLPAARDRYRGIREGKGEQMIMLAAVNGGLWLMESYRGGAADPVLWNYVPLLLAVICGMLLYMDCAGLAAGAAHPRRTLWLAASTVVISAVAIPGGRDFGSILLLAAQIFAALAVLLRLPVNMEHPPVAEETAPQEEEIQEENQDV